MGESEEPRHLQEWRKAVEAAEDDKERIEKLSQALERQGIGDVEEHFIRRIIERGLSVKEIIAAYKKGGIYFDNETGNYIYYSRPNKVVLVVDSLQNGKLITAFRREKGPPKKWNKVRGTASSRRR